MDYKVGTTDGQSKGLQVLGIGEPWPIKSQCESRNILPNKEQSEVNLHRRRSCTNACEISINAVSERPEEVLGVNALDECFIPVGMGKYIPVQTNCGVTGDILIEISDKTVPGLVMPEIV